MLAFGLSRSFGALILSRCLTGLLNGNIGVMKSLMGELTDSTNRAEGYAWLPVVWGFGVTIGPLIGGSLSHPHERFSKVFSGSFWKEYPYFLPCLVTSSYVVFAFLVTLVILKEPLATKKNSQPSSLESCNDSDSTTALVHENDPLPLHKVLTYPVILSIFNFGTVAFLDIAAMALLPLFLAMPLDIGGLNFDPSFIGYVMGSLGLVDAIFQIFFLFLYCEEMGRTKCVHCGHVRFCSDISDISADQLGCAGMGLAIVRRLGFDRHLNRAGGYHGSGIRCYFYFSYRCRSQPTFTRNDKWTFSNHCFDCSSYRSGIVDLIVFVFRGKPYSRWLWSLCRFRRTLGLCSLFRYLFAHQTLGST